jgi:hypothetical protein
MGYFVRSAPIEPGSMDHLALVEEHVAAGERIIAKQRAVLEHLERAGQDTEIAKDVLALFTETQAMYVGDRNLIQAELACKRVAVDSY